MYASLFVLWVLNAIDAVATVYGVTHGYAVEGNPAMAYLLDHGVALFLAFKVVSVTLLIAYFVVRWRQDPHRSALYVVWALDATYLFLAINHAVVYTMWRSL